MYYQEDLSSRNGGNDFQNASLGVDLRNTHSSDTGVSPSDQGWLTEGSDLSREYPTGTSPRSHGGSKGTPSPSPPSHQLHPVKPQSSRQRTSQACDKCRERKTKCSGHRPVCLRCTNRGLICEYSMRETRSRTPARARVAAPAETLQVEYTGQGRPTPALHSRIGGGRTNAFAPPTRSYTGTTVPQGANRPPNASAIASSTTNGAARNLLVPPVHHPQQPRQLPDTTVSNLFSNHTAVAANPANLPYSAGGAWSMYDTSLPMNYNFGASSYDSSMMQPSYSTMNAQEENMNTDLPSISLPQSSLRQLDYELSSLLLPSTPASDRTHDLDSRPAHTFPCCVNEDASCYIPPYTSNIDPTFFQGGSPNLMYNINNSNSSASTLASTPMGSQSDLACPTRSIPIDPAAFRDVEGAFNRSFNFTPPPEYRYPPPSASATDKNEYFGYSSFK